MPADIEEEALRSGPYESIKDKINNLVLLKAVYDQKRKNPNFSSPYEAHLNAYLKSNSIVNRISRQELEYILQSSTKRTFPRKLADRICAGNKKKIKLSLNMNFEFFALEGFRRLIVNGETSIVDSGRVGLIKAINKQLTKNKPVAASYRTKIFYEPKSEAYENAGMHVSTIVGRRWNKETKTCEFKLRNSWGKNCYSYTNPELKGKCDPQTGYVWLPSNILARSIQEAIYFRGSR